MTNNIFAMVARIAQLIGATESQVNTAITLLDEGATVPFIARYRKELTGGLNDTQLRVLSERLCYLRELDERRAVILQTISEQDKLTPDLQQAILAAETKIRLEDLYLPYRPKRRSKALTAKEAGLEPLALDLWNNPTLNPEEHAANFLSCSPEVTDVETALEGARQILMEHFSEDPELIQELREYLWQHGIVKSVAAKNKKASAQKFSDYFNYEEAAKSIPSHRALALFRGRRESALQLSLLLPNATHICEELIANKFNISEQQRLADAWLMDSVRLTWRTKLLTKLELELFTHLRESADEEAIRVFKENLRDLLLAAPAGAQVTMGLDPGIRTGVKVAVVDATGQLLDHACVFPFAPHNDWYPAITVLAKLAAKYQVQLISIGNGTGSRETERLVIELSKMYPDLNLTKVVVSEAGASVYSASELAAREFPDLDVTFRGAVSIARRLQDPLAELVKIEPKSIGVGQYQHDVNQTRLARSLDGIVEDCVNLVGVNVNTASVALLTYVSGLNESLAKQIVQHRDEQGAFLNRQDFLQVMRFGEKTFQQAVGFLRIQNGNNPLDASGVHPETYDLIDQMRKDLNLDSVQDLLSNHDLLSKINLNNYITTQYGLPTIQDVIKELGKPGQDPRPNFKVACFKEGIEDINDVQIGMILEGVVSNVTNFGAFVDIGVHQDGLVHISAMTDRFIRDPRLIVKTGDVVTVKVIEVNKERRRIGLTMKIANKAASEQPQKIPNKLPKKPVKLKERVAVAPKPPTKASKKPTFNTAMADALAKLKHGSEA